MGELVSVTTESVGMSQRCRCASVTEEMHEFVGAFLILVVETKTSSVPKEFGLNRGTYSQNMVESGMLV